MERMKEQIAEIFAMLEAKLAVTEREYYEIVAAQAKAYERWKTAQEAFAHIDALQGLIDELEETSDE